jgi:hypothetical protein
LLQTVNLRLPVYPVLDRVIKVEGTWMVGLSDTFDNYWTFGNNNSDGTISSWWAFNGLGTVAQKQFTRERTRRIV